MEVHLCIENTLLYGKCAPLSPEHSQTDVGPTLLERAFGYKKAKGSDDEPATLFNFHKDSKTFESTLWNFRKVIQEVNDMLRVTAAKRVYHPSLNSRMFNSHLQYLQML